MRVLFCALLALAGCATPPEPAPKPPPQPVRVIERLAPQVFAALVWQRYSHLGPLDETATSRSRPHAAAAVEGLLELLENAIPEILLR